MLTYPVQPSVLTGNATLAQVQAFLKSPTQLARRFSEIISAQNFVSHLVLRGRYQITGGAIAFTPDEAIKAADKPQSIAPGGEYPLVTLNADQAQMLAGQKKGLGTEITDEEVGRLLMDPVERAIALLANSTVDDFDSIAMALVASAITQTVAGGAWTGASAKANLVANVGAAKSTLIKQKKGYKADLILMTLDQYDAITPTLVELLPREAGNPVLSGGWPNTLGLTWVANENLPAGWVPTVLDSANLGGIGHEVIPSPEYRLIDAMGGSNVEVATFREKNDSTRIQVRKADVPVIRNPGAGVEITGTGL